MQPTPTNRVPHYVCIHTAASVAYTTDSISPDSRGKRRDEHGKARNRPVLHSVRYEQPHSEGKSFLFSKDPNYSFHHVPRWSSMRLFVMTDEIDFFSICGCVCKKCLLSRRWPEGSSPTQSATERVGGGGGAIEWGCHDVDSLRYRYLDRVTQMYVLGSFVDIDL